jgi:hypothetical protein
MLISNDSTPPITAAPCLCALLRARGPSLIHDVTKSRSATPSVLLPVTSLSEHLLTWEHILLAGHPERERFFIVAPRWRRYSRLDASGFRGDFLGV